MCTCANGVPASTYDYANPENNLAHNYCFERETENCQSCFAGFVLTAAGTCEDENTAIADTTVYTNDGWILHDNGGEGKPDVLFKYFGDEELKGNQAESAEKCRNSVLTHVISASHTPQIAGFLDEDEWDTAQIGFPDFQRSWLGGYQDGNKILIPGCGRRARLL